jgi:protein TonB
MSTSAENKNKYTALVFTIGFHALLFLLFVFLVFVTPIPPFEIKPVPEIEISLGMEGMGNMKSGGSGQNEKELAASPDVTPTKAVANDAPNLVTDDAETVSIKTNPKNKKEVKTEIVAPPTVEEQKASTELLNALARMKSAKERKGKGAGDGNTGGSGNGDKQGVGDGPGNGIGNGRPGGNGGTGYDLRGRSLIRRPDRMTDSDEEGIVVVEIIVDETGKVIKATPGARGSTTTSSKLYAKARGAALEAKFNASSEGIKEQRGTYTFVFILE